MSCSCLLIERRTVNPSCTKPSRCICCGVWVCNACSRGYASQRRNHSATRETQRDDSGWHAAEIVHRGRRAQPANMPHQLVLDGAQDSLILSSRLKAISVDGDLRERLTFRPRRHPGRLLQQVSWPSTVSSTGSFAGQPHFSVEMAVRRCEELRPEGKVVSWTSTDSRVVSLPLRTLRIMAEFRCPGSELLKGKHRSGQHIAFVRRGFC